MTASGIPRLTMLMCTNKEYSDIWKDETAAQFERDASRATILI